MFTRSDPSAAVSTGFKRSSCWPIIAVSALLILAPSGVARSNPIQLENQAGGSDGWALVKPATYVAAAQSPAAGAAHAASPTSASGDLSAGNPIQQENQKPGTTAWQLTTPVRYANNRYSGIEGYAWATSVAAGGSLAVSVSTSAPSYSAEVYRLGWYGGAGARLMATISNYPGHAYDLPAMDPQTGLLDPNWPLSFTVQTGNGWVSGRYLIKLTASTGEQSYVPFTVKDNRASDFLFIAADNTAQAYNAWGGKSLYGFNSSDGKRAYKVSFDRPYDRNKGAGDLLFWETPMLRWLEKDGFDVSYASDVDLSSDASLLQKHKAVLFVGHSEYWTKEARDNLEAAIANGVSVGVFAADTMEWQVRYEPQPDRNDPLQDRVIVGYKDSTLDPLNGRDNAHVTADVRLPPINRPEQPTLGAAYAGYNSDRDFPWVPTDTNQWIFAGSGLRPGDRIPHIVGYEYDAVSSQWPVPAGEQILSKSPVVGADGVSGTSNSTLYTAPSGARVFDSGTMQWNWGLDSYAAPDDQHPDYTNPSIQVITKNLLQNYLSPGHA